MASDDIRLLLKEAIAWKKETGLPRWHAIVGADRCELAMNDFPEEALYTLYWRGQKLDLDDSPQGWSIPRSVTGEE